MNLALLNNGSPSQKLWLNPVCNSITCNELITAPSPVSNTIFNIYRTAGVAIPPAFVTAPCNLIGIPNLDMNPGTNVYTAPRDCYLSINYSMIVSWQPTATAIVLSLFFTINASQSYLFVNYRNDNLGATLGSVPIQVNGILKLNAGDTVGVQFIFNGVGTGFSYSSVSYSGQLI
jgi:hypothetical protein